MLVDTNKLTAGAQPKKLTIADIFIRNAAFFSSDSMSLFCSFLNFVQGLQIG